MGEIVNLRRLRKRHARDAASQAAAEARARHGRTKAERIGQTQSADRARAALEDARLAPADPKAACDAET